MKKIYESEYYSVWDDSESATATSVWEIDDESELILLEKIRNDHDAWQEYTGLYDDYGVMPGALFHRYAFRLSEPFVYITDRIAYNI